MSEWNVGIVDEFRENAGVVGGMFEGKPLLILHHVGAKSGQERVCPLMYQVTDGGYAVFASKAGADSHPDWYYNLLANPDASVEVGTDTVAVSALSVSPSFVIKCPSLSTSREALALERPRKSRKPASIAWMSS